MFLVNVFPEEKANQAPSEWGKGAPQGGVVLFLVIAFTFISIHFLSCPFMAFQFSWKVPQIHKLLFFQDKP